MYDACVAMHDFMVELGNALFKMKSGRQPRIEYSSSLQGSRLMGERIV